MLLKTSLHPKHSGGTGHYCQAPRLSRLCLLVSFICGRLAPTKMPCPPPPPAPTWSEPFKIKGPRWLPHQRLWKNSAASFSQKNRAKREPLQSIGLLTLGNPLWIIKDVKNYTYFYLWNFKKGMDPNLYIWGAHIFSYLNDLNIYF